MTIKRRHIIILMLSTVHLLGCPGKEAVHQEEPESQAVDAAEESVSTEALSLSEPVSVENYIAHYYSDYFILKIIPSNLLARIEEESLVFLADREDNRRRRFTEGAPPESSINKILCVFVADGRTQDHVIPGGSMGYDERDLDDILTYEPLYGPWLDYCYLPDIDGDGIQEAVIFGVAGLGFGVNIWKFQDGEFQNIKSENLTQNPRWQGDTQNALD